MSTKTYTLTEDAQGHKIRKCSEYVITDEAGKVKAVSLLALDGTTPIPLNKNFTAVTSPIVAESYATLIANASNVTDKKITISTESAKMLAEYCRYRGQQTRNLAFGGSYSGTINGVTISYDNGTFSCKGTNSGAKSMDGDVYKHYATLQAGTYIVSIQIVTYSNWGCVKKSDGTLLTYFDQEKHTFTLTEETDVYFTFNLNESQTYDATINIQIEQGTTATDFVPPLTTATTIADANAKGFKVCTEVGGESYELLASLSFDGTKAINSGIVANQDTEISVDASYTSTSSYIIGWRPSTSYVSSRCLKWGSGNFEFAYNGDNTTGKSADHNRHYFESIANKMSIDGTLYKTATYATFTCGSTLAIGSCNISDSGYSLYSQMFVGNMYSLLIDDNLFIPAKLGENSGLLNLTTKEFKPLQSV